MNPTSQRVDGANLMSRGRALVPVFLLLGIGAALLREVLLARYFGVSSEIEIFRLAYSLPNLLSQSVAPAFLAATIPLIVSSGADGSRLNPVIGRILRINAIISVAIGIAGIIAAERLASTLAPGFDSNELLHLTGQIRFAWIFFVLVSFSFGMRAVLNAREIFLPSASSAFLISITFVIGCWCAALLDLRNFRTSTFLMVLAIVASLLVLITHVYFARNDLRQLLLYRDGRAVSTDSGYALISISLIAVMLFKVSYAVPRFIDRAVGSEFQVGVVAALDYSFGILNVPGILISASIVTIAYPGFSRLVANGARRSEFRSYIALSVAVFVVSALVGFLVATSASDIVNLVYGYGEFDEFASETTSTLLGWHALGLGPMIVSLLLTQALFAFSAYWLALGIVVLRIIVKFVAIDHLVYEYGLSGLGASFLVPEVVTMLASIGVLLFLSRRANR